MYNVIYAPKGYHGRLGRRIQQELCKDRAKRDLNAKVKQYTSKEDKGKASNKEDKGKASKDKGKKTKE
jgi:hypothetical protein